MKCNSCGFDNASSAKYCEKCGVELANSKTLLTSGLFCKKNIVIGSAIALVLVLIVVLLSSAGGTTPHGKVLSALDDGNYEEALKLFDENRVEIDTEQKQEIEEHLIEIAEATKNDYIAEALDYDSTIAIFKKLQKFGFAEVNSYTKELESEISEIDSVRVIIKAGEECFQEKNYIGAIHYFSEVSSDSSNYHISQEKLAAAQEAYRKSLQDQASTLAKEKDYIGAISLLKSGFEVLENDQALVTDIATYTDSYIASISNSVKQLTGNGEYPEAIQLIEEAKANISDSRLDELYATSVSAYVSAVVSKADTYAAEENYALAIEEINTALRILPEDKQLQDALKKHNWTTVLYSGDSFTIVRKDLTTFESNIIRVGVMDANGKWIVPLSSDFIFAEAIRKESGRATMSGSRTEITSKNVYYLGEGVFIMSLGMNVRSTSGNIYSVGSAYSVTSSGLVCYMYNTNNGTQTSFNAVWISECNDGNMLMYNSSRYNSPFYRVDSFGNITELPVRHDVNDYKISGFSEGLFFANGYFYDVNGSKKINLTDYDITNAPYFSDGVCKIEFKNNMGTKYWATIDKNGKFVQEPEKVS